MNGCFKFIHYIFIIILCNQGCCTDGINSEKDADTPLKHDFDVLIFTQRWPVTVCFEWKEKDVNHQCTLPSPKEIWTIHGIWPTKFHTMGPFFCNHSAPFDKKQIEPIEKQLEVYWLNIEKGTSLESLWKHEWQKHGTCAAQLPLLDNENKYFGQGLKWLQQFSMSSFLSQANILPGASYSLEQIHKVLKSMLNANPVIECIHDKSSNKSLLFEIRICFSKDLKLVDCDGVSSNLNPNKGWRKTDADIITNCNAHREIEYLSVVPPTVFPTYEGDSFWTFPFVQLYKLLRMLQWATL
jgi:ribonuclease T2